MNDYKIGGFKVFVAAEECEDDSFFVKKSIDDGSLAVFDDEGDIERQISSINKANKADVVVKACYMISETRASRINNNHDRMVEEIAELKAALELMILQFESDHNCEYEYKVIKSSKNLLAKLNQEGEE